MSACGEWAWFHPEHGYSRFFCGSAACHRVECRNLFWSRRVRLITALIDEYSLNKFFTSTLDPSFIKGDPWRYIAHPWSKLRKRIARIVPNFRFVAVLEGHKTRDCPHIHGFTNVWLHQRKWSTLWHDVCGGSIVWVERVETEGLSSYVSKSINVARYVGKEQLIAGYKHRDNQHTLWRSKNTKAKFELTSDQDWCIVKENIYKESGEKTDWADKKGVWAYGKEEQQGQDVETTRCALPQSSVETSIIHMETEV